MTAPPQESLDRAARRKQRAWAILSWLLVAAAAVAVIADWRFPLIAGLVGGVATVWRAAVVPGGLPRVRVLLIGAILTASVVAWSFSLDWRLVSVGGFCAALVLYPALQMVQRRDDGDAPSAQLGRLVRGLVIGVSIAVSLVAIVGGFERNQASFAMRYGELVEVTINPDCAVEPVTGLPCPDVTWSINGTTYAGTLLIGPSEFATNVTDAYAYPGDDRIYSARHASADIDGLEPLGFVPTWPALVGVIMLVIVALPARVRNRIPGFGRVS